MPRNDYNTYWPVGAPGPAKLTMPLYPGVTLARDVKFGPNPKDVIDIFSPEKGGGDGTVLIYVPGGAGNKIEQQERYVPEFHDTARAGAVLDDTPHEGQDARR